MSTTKDLPSDYEKWERLAKVLNQNTDLKHIVAIIDLTHTKVHMHAT